MEEEVKSNEKETGLHYKDLGNKEFENGNIEAAISFYTKAIV